MFYDFLNEYFDKRKKINNKLGLKRARMGYTARAILLVLGLSDFIVTVYYIYDKRETPLVIASIISLIIFVTFWRLIKAPNLKAIRRMDKQYNNEHKDCVGKMLVEYKVNTNIKIEILIQEIDRIKMQRLSMGEMKHVMTFLLTVLIIPVLVVFLGKTSDYFEIKNSIHIVAYLCGIITSVVLLVYLVIDAVRGCMWAKYEELTNVLKEIQVFGNCKSQGNIIDERKHFEE